MFMRIWRDLSLNKRLRLVRVSGCLRIVVFTGCSDEDPTNMLCQSGPYIALLHAVQINYEVVYARLCDHRLSSVCSSQCPRMHAIMLGLSPEEEDPCLCAQVPSMGTGSS